MMFVAIIGTSISPYLFFWQTSEEAEEDVEKHKVGFFEMQTLYDTSLKYDNIHFYNEWFCTSILTDDNSGKIKKFCGITAVEIKTGNFLNS